MEEKITVAGGCFWCTEAIFSRLRGVLEVTPGYSGGVKEKPTYEEVSLGNTGHAEAIDILFNPEIISIETIFEVFWKLHDPTTVDRQGADVGSQYRSCVFYRNEAQKNVAEAIKRKIQDSGYYGDKKIVTEIVEFKSFYPAEAYHKDYYEKNSGAMYCRAVIDPKIKKLLSDFGTLVK